MTELRHGFALAALLLPLFASGVAAQQTISVEVLSIGDRKPTNSELETIGLTECEMNVDIVYELGTVPSSQLIDVYIGSDCSGPSRHDTQATDCVHVTSTPNNVSEGLRVTISAKNLLPMCSGTAGAAKVWFLAVEKADSTEEPKGVGQHALMVDLTLPSAPSSLKGGSGERQIEVSWDLPSGDDLDGFIVYIDSSPGGSTSGGSAGGGSGDDEDGGANADGGASPSGPAACASSRIREGMSAADVPDTVTVKTIRSKTATRTTLGPSDIQGDVAAVAVSAVDIAGNRSNLSEVVCVKVVDTDTFWERYKNEGGQAEGGCPCAALGPVHVREAWPVALALFSLARRRRRARC